MSKLVVVASALCFGTALGFVKEGYKIARDGWNGKHMFVELQVPDENSKMRRPYLYMSPVDGALVPWVASQSDLLADDWVVLQEVKDSNRDEETCNAQYAGEAAPSTAGVGYDPHWQEVNTRMECLRTAVGLIASGQGRKGDPLELAKEFYSFANGK